MLVLQVSWDAQAADFKAAVETLSNVEEVEVTKDEWTDETGYDFYRWTVRDARAPFLAEVCPSGICLHASFNRRDFLNGTSSPQEQLFRWT